ncbi:DUF1772-domain-containing protein [Polychaeton citri CBS 116435]|uniref:DUF1772-domain-containing protein n=1 Tax=Polychaeton citri CBS 116435 TaxID=1314669 RepID=A0A9P4URS6_9PEZI|nr:DUF1772-domain-containing protein [Polychaeton citri CBS 116435]
MLSFPLTNTSTPRLNLPIVLTQLLLFVLSIKRWDLILNNGIVPPNQTLPKMMSMVSSVCVQATGLLTGAFLSGAMMSLCFVAVPVILDTATETSQLLGQWSRMYHYGHQIMPTIAVCTLLLHGYTSLRKNATKRPWALFALAGLTTVSIAPFTWIFMAPTNNELFRLEEESLATPLGLEDSGARALVVKWTWLHFTRSLLPLAGTVFGTVATFSGA